jgi:hypothetical protein
MIPVLARSDGEVIDGHLRLKAARRLGITEIPVILCDEWAPAQVNHRAPARGLTPYAFSAAAIVSNVCPAALLHGPCSASSTTESTKIPGNCSWPRPAHFVSAQKGENAIP